MTISPCFSLLSPVDFAYSVPFAPLCSLDKPEPALKDSFLHIELKSDIRLVSSNDWNLYILPLAMLFLIGFLSYTTQIWYAALGGSTSPQKYTMTYIPSRKSCIENEPCDYHTKQTEMLGHPAGLVLVTL